MNRLKEIRSRYGFTQKQIADELKTTQQTVARWETGKTNIPVPQLKDLATLFSCSVDDLLGSEVASKLQRNASFARSTNDLPFGTLELGFNFGKREYPIDQQQKSYFLGKLCPDFDLGGVKGWLQVGTLNNLIVFVNPALLTNAALISDDTEQMPYFASPEAYRALTKNIPESDLGPIVLKELTTLVDVLADGIEPQQKREYAETAVSSVNVIRADGQTDTYPLDVDAGNFYELINDNQSIGTNAFLTLRDDEYTNIVNLNSVAVIEVPLEQYLETVSEDEDEDED